MPRTQWSKTPPGPAPRYDWEAITAKLRTHPGEWTPLIGPDGTNVGTRSLAGAITRKKMAALQSEEWDYLVTTRENDTINNRCKIWMSAVRKETA